MMRLHIPKQATNVTRLTFRKQGFPYCYIIVDESNLSKVESELKQLIQDNISIDPFYKGHRISVDIREYNGSKVGKSKSISIGHSMTPEEFKNIIEGILTEKNSLGYLQDKEGYKENLALQYEIQSHGINIVCCSHCGTVNLHRTTSVHEEEKPFTCYECDHLAYPSDCPDLFY